MYEDLAYKDEVLIYWMISTYIVPTQNYDSCNFIYNSQILLQLDNLSSCLLFLIELIPIQIIFFTEVVLQKDGTSIHLLNMKLKGFFSSFSDEFLVN